MKTPMSVHGLIWLAYGDENFGGPGRIALLEAIRSEGSITKAARHVNLSYKAAWESIDRMNNLAGEPLVVRTTGGRGGGSTRLTERGERLIRNFRLIEEEHHRFLDVLSQYTHGMPDDLQLFRRLNLMKTSARNQFIGKVAALHPGSVNDEVDIEISGGQRIVAIVTRESSQNLGLAVGREVFALVKAPSVVIAVDIGKAKLSTRNRLEGKIARLSTGAVNSEVVVDLPAGGSIAAIVTKESADNMGLKPGAKVTALFKASNVIVGTVE